MAKLFSMDPKVIGKTAFPSYRGRKFRLNTDGYVCFCDLNWSGGTRNSYSVVRLSDGMVASGHNNFAPWSNPIEGKCIDVPSGYAIVEWTQFCGKDLGLRIYLSTEEPVYQDCLD